MSTVETTNRWIEAAGDRLNAILVKETRQALKSRQFLATFLLMLIASWLISMFGIMLSGPQLQFGETGKQFFFMYYVVLAVAIFVVVPFGAFRSLLTERDLNTFELLSITTLSPWRIVWGKLLSALVQLFIYYSAIAPFIAFTNLLNGITFPTIAFLLFVSLLMSAHVSMFALMLSTFARQRHTQVLSSVMLMGGLASLFFSSFGWVVGALQLEIPFDRAEFWWTLGISLSYFIPTFVLCLQLATAQLTFESDNRSTGIRITCAVIFWLSMLWIGWSVYITALRPTLGSVFGITVDDRAIWAWTTSLVFWLAAVGVFAVTEDDHLSRRLRRDLPRSRLKRFLLLPFLPGGGRGFLYVLIHLAVLVGGSLYAVWLIVGRMPLSREFIGTIASYLLIYLGAGSALGRLIRSASGEIRASHARVLLLFLLAGGSILPHLVGLYDWRVWQSYPLVYITDPFSTSIRVLDDTASPWTLTVLLLCAAFALAANLRPVFKGITEVMQAEVRPKPVPKTAVEPG